MYDAGAIDRRECKFTELMFDDSPVAVVLDDTPFSEASIPNDRDDARLLLAAERPAANPDDVGVNASAAA